MNALRRASCAALLSAAAAAGAQAGAPLAGQLPLRREGAADAGDAWGTPALVVALAGAAGAWALWRRHARRKPGAAREGEGAVMQRVSSQALTPQASVHCVRWNGEEFLLGCTAQQVTLLCRRAPAAAREPAP